jgi:hypothetical protein
MLSVRLEKRVCSVVLGAICGFIVLLWVADQSGYWPSCQDGEEGKYPLSDSFGAIAVINDYDFGVNVEWRAGDHVVMYVSWLPPMGFDSYPSSSWNLRVDAIGINPLWFYDTCYYSIPSGVYNQILKTSQIVLPDSFAVINDMDFIVLIKWFSDPVYRVVTLYPGEVDRYPFFPVNSTTWLKEISVSICDQGTGKWDVSHYLNGMNYSMFSTYTMKPTDSISCDATYTTSKIRALGTPAFLPVNSVYC